MGIIAGLAVLAFCFVSLAGWDYPPSGVRQCSIMAKHCLMAQFPHLQTCAIFSYSLLPLSLVSMFFGKCLLSCCPLKERWSPSARLPLVFLLCHDSVTLEAKWPLFEFLFHIQNLVTFCLDGFDRNWIEISKTACVPVCGWVQLGISGLWKVWSFYLELKFLYCHFLCVWWKGQVVVQL